MYPMVHSSSGLENMLIENYHNICFIAILGNSLILLLKCGLQYKEYFSVQITVI